MTTVAIYIYPEAEVLDFSGPYEVFSTASRVAGKPVFDVFLVSGDGKPLTARAGYRVCPHYSIHDHPPIDVLIVAGGVHRQEMDNAAALQWIAEQNRHSSITASVCTGAFLLARAGLMTRRQVTTHWEDCSDLQKMFPDLQVITDKRWVVDKKFVTSGGISAGIDMSLDLVRRLGSEQLALSTARQMDYYWNQNPDL
jgi:transcriptional regulator GlxA family with amidase domain